MNDANPYLEEILRAIEAPEPPEDSILITTTTTTTTSELRQPMAQAKIDPALLAETMRRLESGESRASESLLAHHKKAHKNIGGKTYPKNCLGEGKCTNALCAHTFVVPEKMKEADPRTLTLLMNALDKAQYPVSERYARDWLHRCDGKIAATMEGIKNDLHGRQRKLDITGRVNTRKAWLENLHHDHNDCCPVHTVFPNIHQGSPAPRDIWLQNMELQERGFQDISKNKWDGDYGKGIIRTIQLSPFRDRDTQKGIYQAEADFRANRAVEYARVMAMTDLSESEKDVAMDQFDLANALAPSTADGHIYYDEEGDIVNEPPPNTATTTAMPKRGENSSASAKRKPRVISIRAKSSPQIKPQSKPYQAMVEDGSDSEDDGPAAGSSKDTTTSADGATFYPRSDSLAHKERLAELKRKWQQRPNPFERRDEPENIPVAKISKKNQWVEFKDQEDMEKWAIQKLIMHYRKLREEHHILKSINGELKAARLYNDMGEFGEAVENEFPDFVPEDDSDSSDEDTDTDSEFSDSDESSEREPLHALKRITWKMGNFDMFYRSLDGNVKRTGLRYDLLTLVTLLGYVHDDMVATLLPYKPGISEYTAPQVEDLRDRIQSDQITPLVTCSEDHKHEIDGVSRRLFFMASAAYNMVLGLLKEILEQIPNNGDVSENHDEEENVEPKASPEDLIDNFNTDKNKQDFETAKNDEPPLAELATELGKKYHNRISSKPTKELQTEASKSISPAEAARIFFDEAEADRLLEKDLEYLLEVQYFKIRDGLYGRDLLSNIISHRFYDEALDILVTSGQLKDAVNPNIVIDILAGIVFTLNDKFAKRFEDSRPERDEHGHLFDYDYDQCLVCQGTVPDMRFTLKPEKNRSWYQNQPTAHVKGKKRSDSLQKQLGKALVEDKVGNAGSVREAFLLQSLPDEERWSLVTKTIGKLTPIFNFLQSNVGEDAEDVEDNMDGQDVKDIMELRDTQRAEDGNGDEGSDGCRVEEGESEHPVYDSSPCDPAYEDSTGIVDVETMKLFLRMEKIAAKVSGCKLVYPPFKDGDIEAFKKNTGAQTMASVQLCLSLNGGSVTLATKFWELAVEEAQGHVRFRDPASELVEFSDDRLALRYEVEIVRWGTWQLEKRMAHLEATKPPPPPKSKKALKRAAKKEKAAAKGRRR